MHEHSDGVETSLIINLFLGTRMKNIAYMSFVLALCTGSIEAMLPLWKAMQDLTKKTDRVESVESVVPITSVTDASHNQEQNDDRKSDEKRPPFPSWPLWPRVCR